LNLIQTANQKDYLHLDDLLIIQYAANTISGITLEHIHENYSHRINNDV